MAVLSFKDVGEKTVDVVERRMLDATTVPPPLGIATPIRAGDELDGFFKMHRSLREQLKDNLRNLLQTNHGDRVMQYDFGANLQPLVFDMTSQDNFDSTAMLRIKRAVERHMPFVELVDFERRVVRANVARSVGYIDIHLTYNIPRIGVDRDHIVVRFALGG